MIAGQPIAPGDSMSARLNWIWCDGLAAVVLVGICAALAFGWLG